MNSAERKARHEKAERELRSFRDRKSALYEELNAREARSPGSVSQQEWSEMRAMDKKSRTMQDRVHRLAREYMQGIGDDIRREQAERRQGVADGLARGDSVKKIAEDLGVSTSTVYKYRKMLRAEETPKVTPPVTAEGPKVAPPNPRVVAPPVFAPANEVPVARRKSESAATNSGCASAAAVLLLAGILILAL